MKCPGCPDATLVMADRQGVEIDYCPACRGIWLDRGELDKLLDRAAAVTAAAPVHAPGPASSRPMANHQRCVAQCKHLGVSGWVAGQLTFIVPCSDDQTITHDDCTDGYVAMYRRRVRLAKRQLHCVEI